MIETMTYFGPAVVTDLEMRDKRISITLPEGEVVRARLALAVPYSPAPGDQVLVIGQEKDEIYIIGVLLGRGTTTLAVPGDLKLDAPNGNIELSSARGVRMKSKDAVEVEAPRITLRTGKLETIAERVVEKAQDIYRWVSGLLQLKSKRMRTVVDSSYQVNAERAYLQADLDMNLDGKNINLG